MEDFSQEELGHLMILFRHQTLEIIETMSQDLLTLEHSGPDEAIIRRIRRGAHTIKGDSSCVDLNLVTELSHLMESFFDEVLTDFSRFTPEAVNVILAGLDAIRAALSETTPRDVTAEELSRFCAQLTTVQKEREAGADLQFSEKTSPQPADEDSASPATMAISSTAPAQQEYVRVNAGVIDALMNLAGEMIIAGSMMNAFGAKLENEFPKNDLVRLFQNAHGRTSKLVSELQKTVLEMRMVPISQLFRRFARPMRELAAESGKQVDLISSGETTELDRNVVEQLYEPLLHLLRNAVDHGLELPETRLDNNKPGSGKIHFNAFHEGNQVIVEIRDDGRGIDVEALRARAVETGQISPLQAEALSHEEALQLIFLPGLSTASEITLVSGRGVGMAAVKSAIEQLRGQIHIRSEHGVGTTFTLRLPLTLAIIRALLFTASGRLYALPLLATSEIKEIRAEEIYEVDGVETWRLREQWISLIRPGQTLGHERRRGGRGEVMRETGKRYFALLLKVSNRNFALLADEMLGEQELVTRPLDSEWLNSEVLAGASVLGDGRVALILDAGNLIQIAIEQQRSKAAGIGVYTG